MAETLTTNEKAKVILANVQGLMKQFSDFPETEEMRIAYSDDREYLILNFIYYEKDELSMPTERIVSPPLWIPLDIALSENPRIEILKLMMIFVKEVAE